MVKKVVRKSVSSKPSIPTKSVSSGKQYEHAKVNYDKLSDMEKMEYDLKQLEQEEYCWVCVLQLTRSAHGSNVSTK